MPGVRSFRGSKTSQCFLLAVILLAAFAVAPAAASACSAGPYTECIPGSGHSGAHTSTAASIPTASNAGGGNGSNAGSQSGSGANTDANGNPRTQGNGGKSGSKDQQGSALPVSSGTGPGSSSGGGIPAIAWILIALALIALVGGSILVLRNRRNAAGSKSPHSAAPGPNQPGTASDVS